MPFAERKCGAFGLNFGCSIGFGSTAFTRNFRRAEAALARPVLGHPAQTKDNEYFNAQFVPGKNGHDHKKSDQRNLQHGA